jgi:hypothetical protein
MPGLNGGSADLLRDRADGLRTVSVVLLGAALVTGLVTAVQGGDDTTRTTTVMLWALATATLTVLVTICYVSAYVLTALADSVPAGDAP